MGDAILIGVYTLKAAQAKKFQTLQRSSSLALMSLAL